MGFCLANKLFFPILLFDRLIFLANWLFIYFSSFLNFLSSQPVSKYDYLPTGLLDGVSSKPVWFRYTR